MNTIVYFVRHSLSEISIKDDKIRPLTDLGYEKTKFVTEFLKDKMVTKIYSSPYKRSIDTLKDFSEALCLQIYEIDDFRERAVGTWVEDFRTYSKQQWDDFSFKLDEGESLKETQERNISALTNVLKQNKGETIAIGTHGTALSTIINYYNPTFLTDDFYRIIDKMPWIVCFTFEDEKLLSIKEIDLF